MASSRRAPMRHRRLSASLPSLNLDLRRWGWNGTGRLRSCIGARREGTIPPLLHGAPTRSYAILRDPTRSYAILRDPTRSTGKDAMTFDRMLRVGIDSRSLRDIVGKGRCYGDTEDFR
jgi:hypothetical protein